MAFYFSRSNIFNPLLNSHSFVHIHTFLQHFFLHLSTHPYINVFTFELCHDVGGCLWYISMLIPILFCL